MPLSLLAFLFLALSVLSVWFSRRLLFWGSAFLVSVVFGLFSHLLSLVAVPVIAGWALLWMIYQKQEKAASRSAFFILFAFCSFLFKFHLLPGFSALQISQRFFLGFETPILGLFPLALLVPLAAQNAKEWREVLIGVLWGCGGIALLTLAATVSGAVHWEYKVPSFAAERYFSNLIFIAIPEEAFYRGFLQNTLYGYVKRVRGGSGIAIGVVALIFTAAHLFWSPNSAILLFVFLSSLLYGWVYWISKRIESAIITHFLLNFVHMTFFSYHAM